MVNEVYSGAVTNVLISDAETTYGTTPAVPNWKSLGMLYPDITHTERNELIKARTVGSPFAQQIVSGKYVCTGSVTGLFQIGRLLALFMGTDTKSGVGPYTHTLTYNNILPSFSMIVSRGASANRIVQTFTGCAVTGVRINSSLDQPLQITADFIAQLPSMNTTGSQAVSIDTDTVQVPQYGSLKIPNTTAIAQVQNFEASLTRKVADVYQIGSVLRQGIPSTACDIGLRATVNFTDTECVQIFKDMYNDSSAPYTIASTRDTADQTAKFYFTNSGATTALRDITFNAVGLRWEEVGQPTRAEDVTTMELSGQIRNFDTASIVTTDNNNVTYPNG